MTRSACGLLVLAILGTWACGTAARATDPKPPFELQPEPIGFKPGEPLSTRTLVREPSKLDGAVSWTIETRRHRGYIAGLDASPDGRLVATGGLDGTVRIWDAATGALQRVLVGHNSYCFGVSWSPSMPLVATAGHYDYCVRLWDVRTGRLMRTFKDFKTYITRVDWSPDGTRLLACGGQSGWIWLWNGPNNEAKQLIDVGQTISDLAWSPDGTKIAYCGRQLAVSVLDVATGKDPKTFGTVNDVVSSISWSPDSKHLACGGQSATAVWDTAGAGEAPTKTLETPSYAVAMSPDGKLLATVPASSGYVHLHELASDKPPTKLPTVATRLLWHHPSEQLFCISQTRLAIWKVGEKQPAAEVEVAGTEPPLWNPNRPIITGMGTARLQLWDDKSYKHLKTLEGHTAAIQAAAWSRDGKSLATGSADRTARVWKASTGECAYTLKGHESYVRAVAWAPKGDTLATGSLDKTARLWNGAEAEAVLQGHSAAVNVVAWSPTGNLLATGGGDGAVILWNPGTHKQVRTVRAFQSVQSIAIGNLMRTPALACGTVDENILVVNLNTAQQLAALRLGGSPPVVTSLSWLPAGGLLLSGRGNHTMQLWSVADQKTVQNIPTFAGVQYATYTSSGNVLISGTGDAAARFWDAASGKIRGQILDDGKQVFFLSPDGHWKADADRTPELVYVVQQEDAAQVTLTPEEFAAKYRWRNNPMRAKW